VNSDCIVIMGSNMAECHPVGFQWVMEAKLHGATVIHVDPRFTRTSANASFHVPVRAGSDIAFLGGIVNYILENDRYFREYVVHYTNAATIVRDDFRDTEDGDGYFSGFKADEDTYDPSSWQYLGQEATAAAGYRPGRATRSETTGALGGSISASPAERDETLQHPRCVFQILRRHFRRYTPEFVERTTGVPVPTFMRVAQAVCDNSTKDRTTAFVYSVGWTQHTVGVQYIRTTAIIQLLLGNMGRPGGGILALRGHASIQGSTDIPTLYDLLPGYIPMPHAEDADLETFLAGHHAAGGGWGNFSAYVVSLLKAYFGDAATAENDFGFGWLPRINREHHAYHTALAMLEDKVAGYFLLGENPAVGNANSGLHRRALAHLDWLVVRDLFEIESAAFWYDAPEVKSGEMRTEDIKTEVFLLPAAAHTEKDGSFTNTQRLLQWHHKAVEPKGDCRSELWFMYHLGRIIRDKLKGSTDARDHAILNLAWDYPTSGPHSDPSADAVLREINGWGPEGKALTAFNQLKDDGSTTCGCWIYCGSYADEVNQPARKKPGSEQSWVAPEWGWAWPANRRLLYNRASADPSGKPWSERKRYVWWDARKKEWTGHDVPDFAKSKAPSYAPPEDAKADAALPGDAPFIMQGDGRGWLYVPSGLMDGPLPTHYEPHESPVSNELYETESNPVRERYENRFNPYQDGDDSYPFVMTTYRLTEHHTAGGMSRNVPVLSELQPEMFCEISPELARERRLEQGGWATVITARTAIEVRVMVTDRVAPLKVAGKTLHQVGLPYHWGTQGIVTGDSANDLFPIVLDPNVHIQEVKAATCDIRPGRVAGRVRGAIR
jgi:formate dehydrogenase major subunit